MASNLMIAEDIFANKLLFDHSINIVPYNASELQDPKVAILQQLFALHNRNYPLEMQHFYEDLYTQ